MRSIALISHSTDPALTPAVLAEIAHALGRQLVEHYAGVWQRAGVPVECAASDTQAPAESVLMVVFDAASDPGILGYHDVSPTGKPYGKCFWGPIKGSGGTVKTGDNSLSVTLSHECLELMADPYANWWVDMPDGVTEEALELCDRVEGDSYEIDGVSVSNFLGPRAFRNGVGPYDFLGMQGDPRGLTYPFEVRSNGYVIRRTGGPTGTTTSIFGAEYPEHKKALKLEPGTRPSMRGVGVEG